MAGYIGKSQGVTQVDGYNRTEADDRYVNASGDTMTGALGVAGEASASIPNGCLIDQTAGYLTRILNYSSTTGSAIALYTGPSGSSTERMRIDSAGRVTMPYQPAFHAMATGASNISSGTLYYGGVTFNTGGHYNSSTSRFTAPVSGVYQFHASCYSQSGTGTQVSAKIAVNGVMRQIGEIAEIGGNFGFDGINMSVIVYLNAGDYVAVEWRAGASIHLNANNNSFSGALIG